MEKMETNGENSEEANVMEPAPGEDQGGETVSSNKGSKAVQDSSLVEPASISGDSNGFIVNDNNDSTVMDTSEDLSSDPPELTVEPETRKDENIKPGETENSEADVPPPEAAAQPQSKTTKAKDNPTTTTSSTSSTIASNNQNNDSATTTTADSSKSSKSGRRTRSIRSELDRLLMDEGTVKILMGRGSRSGGASSSADVTKEEKMKELQKNRDLAIQEVREGSTKLFRKVSLRQKSKNRRQLEQQKEKETKSKKLKLESSSKIIRRRSSSSNFNFSSRSPSPLHPTAVTTYTSEDDAVQVRVQDSVGYITISAVAFTFNSQTLSRLTSILNSMKLDDTVTIVQLTTTNDFIQGLDIDCIRSETDDSLRESMADSMIACLDTLLKALMNYPKILVAGVAGEAVDFGVLILTFFDLVFASDKATFQTNYAKNGYLPECLHFFPRNRLTNAMLYTGKKLTATEGLTSGLVTESLWPAKFQAELANRIRTLSTSNQQILLRTKTELTQKKNKLELTRDLRSSWLKNLN